MRFFSLSIKKGLQFGTDKHRESTSNQLIKFMSQYLTLNYAFTSIWLIYAWSAFLVLDITYECFIYLCLKFNEYNGLEYMPY